MTFTEIDCKTRKINIFKVSLIALFLGYFALCAPIVKNLGKTTGYQVVTRINVNQKEKLRNCYDKLQTAKGQIIYAEQYKSLVNVSDCLENLETADLILSMQQNTTVGKDILRSILPSEIFKPITRETTRNLTNNTVETLKISINTPEQVNQALANKQIENNIKTIDDRLLYITRLDKFYLAFGILAISLGLYALIIFLISLAVVLSYFVSKI